MTLRHVEKLLPWISKYQHKLLSELRIRMSQIGDNQGAVDQLRGEGLEKIGARVSEFVLKEIGYDQQAQNHRSKEGTIVSVENKSSYIRRSISRVRGKTRGARSAEAIARDLAQGAADTEAE